MNETYVEIVISYSSPEKPGSEKQIGISEHRLS